MAFPRQPMPFTLVEMMDFANPISTGWNQHPRAVFPALLRNEKRFSLQTWLPFSLISGSQFALSNLRMDLSMLPWQWLKLREFENDIF